MMQKAKHLQRPTGPLPPALSISVSTNSETLTQTDSDSTLFFENKQKPLAAVHIVDASHTILFATTTLKRTISRCISHTSNDNLQSAFTPIINKTRSTTENLGQILNTVEKKSSQEIVHNLIPLTAQCIFTLKELCYVLSTRLSILVQGLDPKYTRHLLVNLYSATVDIKEAWETISPYLTIDPIMTLPSKTKSLNGNKSNSEVTIQSPLSSPLTLQLGDNSQLYIYLKNAVTGSFHVLSPLRQSIEEALCSSNIMASLEGKLRELLRQAQHVTDLSHRLDKSIDVHMSNKDEFAVSSNRQELSKKFWEDTSIYLKVD
ncbi:hypothetical protein G6F46_000387 [Rhizopus delemar]|uniref:Uncharacterized protein n=2 Tax=Rhizopus TaxID=4842 RepID=A0A9P6ZDB2_9FUNG|nr:hypothetical protein G6F55_000304 [Rhizopus delemar]KAG1552753.1 hypothetical protein G6F51_001028 [Rhizopus arrhizus]KAG1505853.1 hypothetical protein G6F54_000008 [Rhizopus delemar]KAG1518761.1 hypothetical protein G6F53_000332 [Rhizopus delemar]KAG1527780.1 hypothetical protein G6F52_001237 [Rhizopus delemar]